MLVGAFQIAGPKKAQVKRRALARLRIEIGRGPVALAMILVAAKLQIAQDLVRHAAALLIGVALLHVVDPALVVMVNGGDHGTERVRAGKQTADAVAAVEASARR